jgi:hypothetical protein
MDGNRHLFYMLAQEDKETRRGEEDKNHLLAAHAGTKDFNVSATMMNSASSPAAYFPAGRIFGLEHDWGKLCGGR